MLQVLETLGPKTAEELAPGKKPKSKGASTEQTAKPTKPATVASTNGHVVAESNDGYTSTIRIPIAYGIHYIFLTFILL